MENIDYPITNRTKFNNDILLDFLYKESLRIDVEHTISHIEISITSEYLFYIVNYLNIEENKYYSKAITFNNIDFMLYDRSRKLNKLMTCVK